VGRTRNGLTYIAELENGQQIPKMDHLVCFLAGTLALGAANGLGGGRNGEHMKLAEALAYTCWKTYEEQPTGLAPEISHFSENGIYVKPADAHNLLRPETIESLFIIYRITGDEKYREWGWKMFESFEKHTKIEGGGYSSLHSVIGGGYQDKMESFFLGETLKYFFLLFDDSKLGLIPLENYVFNTEAHPLPIIPPLKLDKR
jgi:mannosyl-oligosaccharide alpha-1,2-mannosidase